MQRYLVEIFWSDEDKGFIAIVPDLPGCSAWGANEIDALHEIKDTMMAWIEACHKSNEPVPLPYAQPRYKAA